MKNLALGVSIFLLVGCSKNMNVTMLDTAKQNNHCNTQTIPINEGDSEKILIAKNALANQKLIDCHNAIYTTNQTIDELQAIF